MTIEECTKQNIDVDDEHSVQKGFISLFLDYPSDKTNVMAAYKKKSDQLKIDTALDAYVTAIQLSKKMYGQVDHTTASEEAEGQSAQGGKDFSELGYMTQFNYVEQCLIAGNQTDSSGVQKINDACSKTGLEDCSGTGEGEEAEKEERMCLWRNAVLGVRLYEQFMVYNEYLAAMMAQYDAVQAIDGVAHIREKRDREDNQGDEFQESSLLSDELKSELLKTNAIQITSFNLYADEQMQSKTSEEEMDAMFAEYNANLQSAEKVVGGDFEQVDRVEGMVSPTDGKEADFDALEVLAEVQKNLNQSISMHNMKQNLPAYKRTFKSYDGAKRYHDAVVEKLGTAGQCVSNFLEPYYDGASKSWFGKSCNYYDSGKIYCHYSPEKDTKASENGGKASRGDYDIVCPNDSNHLCYVQELTDTKFDSGIIGYLMNLYQAVKDNQANEEVNTFIEVSEENAVEGAYGSRVSVNVVEQEGSVSLTTKDVDETDEFKKAEMEEANDTGSSVATRTQIDKRLAGSDGLVPLSTIHASALPEDRSEGKDIKDHAKADEEKIEMRKSALLNWAIGAEVVKDISNDLLSSNPVFGSAKSRFSIWNDQKSFYDQYVDDKYENIEKYLAKIPFVDAFANSAAAINAVYPYQNKRDDDGHVVMTKEQIRQEALNNINTFRANALAVPVNDRITAEFNNSEQQRLALRSKHQVDLVNKKAQIVDVYKQIDELNTKLSIANRVYNNQQAKLEEKDAVYGAAEEGENYGKDMYASAGRTVDIKASPQNETLQQNQDDQITSERQALETLNVLELTSNPQEMEAQIKRLRDVASGLEEELKNLRQDYVLAMSDLEEETRLKIQSLIEEDDEDMTIENMIADLATDNQPAAIAKMAMQCVREYAKQEVTRVKNTIGEMKASEELYYGAFADKLLEAHNQMVDNIQNINIGAIQGCAAISKLNSLNLNDAETLLKDIVGAYSKICDGLECKKPDEQYFVGVTYKKRDLRAPKSPLTFTTGPLREVFHFDLEDYGNVDMKVLDADNFDNNQNVIITKESFRNSGTELPEVWKAILSDHAYVERDIDLGKLFGNTNSGEQGTGVIGDPEKAMVRSGIYPCQLNRNTIIDINKNFQYTAKAAPDVSHYKLPLCTKVDLSGNRILDKESDYWMSTSGSNDANGDILRTSELGQILAYIPDKEESIKAMLPIPGVNGVMITPTPQWEKIKHRLTFNNMLQKAFQRIDALGSSGDTSPEEFYKYHSGNRVFMDKNQFGEFLDFVELEAKVADSMVELNEKVVEVKNSLADVFLRADYQMSDDFNLLKESDYNKSSDILNTQKEMYLKEAKQNLGKVGAITTEFVQQKIDKLKHVVAVLERDKDEIVAITGNEDLDELDSKIATQQADNSILGEYATEGDASTEAQIRKLPNPICVSYVISGQNKMSAGGETVMTTPEAIKSKAESIEAQITPTQK